MKITTLFKVIVSVMCLLAIGMLAITPANGAHGEASTEPPYLTSSRPIVLLSANDADVLKIIDPQWTGQELDSITMIKLRPALPPIVRTVYSTVPNTITGPPHMAVSTDGRLGFVTSHSLGLDMGPPDDIDDASKRNRAPDQLSVIDLESGDLKVVHRFKLPPYPIMAVAHPDGNRIVVGGGGWFHIFKIGKNGVKKGATYDVPIMVTGFDISADGSTIIATGSRSNNKLGHPFFLPDIQTHILELDEKGLSYKGRVGMAVANAAFDRPFSPRFGPKGKHAIVLNGNGSASKGTLDDALVIDMKRKPPTVTGVIRQVADGPESVAFHPDGKMAVICCVHRVRGLVTSHLAVVSLEPDQPELLCHIPIEPVPEGIEFSSDGKLLFVGCTSADHIVTFHVLGNGALQRSPYVLRTGHGPASLGISR